MVQVLLKYHTSNGFFKSCLVEGEEAGIAQFEKLWPEFLACILENLAIEMKQKSSTLTTPIKTYSDLLDFRTVIFNLGKLDASVEKVLEPMKFQPELVRQLVIDLFEIIVKERVFAYFNDDFYACR